AVRAGRNRHRLEADGDRAGMGQVAGAVDGEDLEPIVRRVDGEEMGPIGRERERTYLTALELDERRCAGDRRERDDDEQAGDETGAIEHRSLRGRPRGP